MRRCNSRLAAARRLLAGLAAAPLLLALSAAPALTQGLDLSGWQIRQYASDNTYTIPDGTVIQPGGYLILSRFAGQSAFEAFYGVTLGPDVVYLTNAVSNPVVPMINGDEIYEVWDATGSVVDGPTPAIGTLYQAYHRDDPEAPPWTAIDGTPTPGGGVEPPDATYSGLVISEANDPGGSGAYVYEYVELYYDAEAGGTNQPPVIADPEHSPATPEDGDDLIVSATVTDPDGTLVEVLCYWRYSGDVFATLPMTGAGDLYSCTIPALVGDQLLEYYLTARDDGGALVSDPAGAPGAVHSVWVQGGLPTGKVVLFDRGHGQDAGSEGNWRIDDDVPYPLPADPSSESDWSGQLSAWAYELYLAGHTLRTTVTPIDAAQLAGVDLLVIVEPQDPFAGAEITAIGEWVHAGGSLFVVANHNGSDRNNNGWDSPSIFGGYSEPHISVPVGDDIETFCGALFGLHFHVKDEGNNGITGTFDNVDSDPANPLINGPSGPVSAVIYHVGNVMSLWPAANPDLRDVAGHIWKDGDTGNPDVNIAAWSRYGLGKILGYGDSSSCADGTGAEPHENDWTEPGGNNREFFLNATWWLLDNDLSAAGDGPPGLSGLHLHAAPNPFNPITTIRWLQTAPGDVEVAIFDLRGRHLRTLTSGRREAGEQSLLWNGRDGEGRPLPSGLYLVRARGAGQIAFTKITLAK